MPAVMEKTISLDRLLLQQADAKLRQYGWTFEDVVARTLIAILSVQGGPEEAFVVPERRNQTRHPGGLRGRVHVAADFDEPVEELADLFENSSV